MMTARNLRRAAKAGLAIGWMLAGFVAASAEDTVIPEVGAVDALQTLFGKHPGFRANHARGVVLEGMMTPSAEGAKLSKSSAFAGPPVKATIRFSDPGGNPDVADNDPEANPKGMALKLTLADGSDWDFAMISTKIFPVATAADFRDLFLAIAATKPDSPKPTPVERFLGAHPAALKWIQSIPSTPASFATESYYGLNAFRLIAASGEVTNVRFRFTPVAGEQRVAAADLKGKGPTFLVDEIRQRVKAGPVLFKFQAQVGAKVDPTDDVTKSWPDDRPMVTLGELAITTADPNSADAEKALLFMPGQVPDGVETSDDPLIASRNGAYAESFGRRN